MSLPGCKLTATRRILRAIALVAAFVVVPVSPRLTCGDEAPAMPAPAGEKYALLVGVRNYDKNELRNLAYPEADVDRLAELLRKSGYRRVVLMTQTLGADDHRFLPTADRIRTSLQTIVARRSPEDTVLVAFAGHGVQFHGDEEVFFCPMDAKLGDRRTLVSLSDVYKSLETCEAGTRLLLADACRNDPRSDHSRARAEVDLESVTRPQKKSPPGGVAAFFSCSAGERSYESPTLRHGVFFHYLLEGLAGKADADRNERVDLDELVAFTRRQVADHVNEEFGDDQSQLPELIGKVRGAVTVAKLAPGAVAARPAVPTSTSAPPATASTKGIVVIGPAARPAGAAPKNDLLLVLNPFEHIAGITPGQTTSREVRNLLGDADDTSAAPKGGELWTWKTHGISVGLNPDRGIEYVYIEAPYRGTSKEGLKIGQSEQEARRILLSSYLLKNYSRLLDGSSTQFFAPSPAKPDQDNFQVWYRDGRLIRMKLFRPR